MRISRKERNYVINHFNEVKHTTLNPDGPGVVRIHLVPADIEGADDFSTMAIINGQDIIPVNASWSILLSEFIDNVNEYHGKSVSQSDVDSIIEKTIVGVKKVYPFIRKSWIRNDIHVIMNTFKQVAYGEEVSENISYISLGDYAPLMKAPHRMDIMVSAMTQNGNWHCNQKCIHCYAAGQKQAEEAELSTEDWKKIIDKIRKIGIPQITFTGGEPTMRDDLFELIDYAKWFVTRLNTNGVVLTQEYCRKLFEVSLDSIQITFYSDDAEIHNKLVGAANYDKTVSGIKNALDAGLSVSVNTPLCTLNKDYKNTLEFLHSLGVNYVTCSGLITTGNALKEDSVNLQLDKEQIKQILKDATDYCYANDMEISFTSPGWIEREFFDEIGVTTPTCGACLSNMAVTPGGNVVPCQSWLSGPVLGNILKDDWSRIWNNPDCAKRRDYSAKTTGLCPLRSKKEADDEN